MKLFHLSDLHLGKSVHEFSMLREQEYLLDVILALAAQERPHGVLLAGDVFDRGVAPADALRLFDDFLFGLSGLHIPVYIIAGNHDSAERLAFAARLIQGAGVHIAPAYEGEIACHTLADEYGELDICLLPFIKPGMVRRYFPQERIETWTDAVKTALGTLPERPGRRRVLVAHQFVSGGQTSESEEFSVGGADNVDASAFSGFDYVALGHLHGPQNMGRDSLRYCGSPMKYSFSEAGHQKSLSIVELYEKGRLSVRETPLTPLHDLKEYKGSYETLAGKAFYQGINREDYLRLTLTDEIDQPDALQKLRVIYPRLMRLDYDNARTRAQGSPEAPLEGEALSPLGLFERLFAEQNGRPLSEEQREYLAPLIEKVWEESV